MNQKNALNQQKLDLISPATKLLEKRRKMYEVQESFENQKAEFQKSEEILKRQEDAIRERDLQIQEDLIKFCTFLQTNQNKKQKAEIRLQDEIHQVNIKNDEIKELKEQIGDLKTQQIRLDRKVSALKKYEEYLEDVMKAHPDLYQDVSEILNRFNMLENSRIQLAKQHKEKEEEEKNMNMEYKNTLQEILREIQTLGNQNKAQTDARDKKIEEKYNMERNFEDLFNQQATKNLNLGKLFLAINNLYTSCTSETVTKVTKIKYDAFDYMKKLEDYSSLEKLSDHQILSEENLNKKKEIAIGQLQAITLYMTDFKLIKEKIKNK